MTAAIGMTRAAAVYHNCGALESIANRKKYLQG